MYESATFTAGLIADFERNVNRYLTRTQAHISGHLSSACQVIDQTKRVFDIASGKVGLILHDFTAVLY